MPCQCLWGVLIANSQLALLLPNPLFTAANQLIKRTLRFAYPVNGSEVTEVYRLLLDVY